MTINFTDNGNKSLGNYVLSASRYYEAEKVSKLIEDFKRFKDETREVYVIEDKKYPGTYRIGYQNWKGITWTIWAPSAINGVMRQCVEALITPKLFDGLKDYIAEGTVENLRLVEKKFNKEASRISDILGEFSDYIIKKGKYLIEFELEKIKNPCNFEQIIFLLDHAITKGSNLHGYYYKNYEKDSSRYKTPYVDYLKSKSKTESVYIRCYGRNIQQDGQKPKNLVQYFVECKYPGKGYPVSRLLNETSDSVKEIIDEMFSDDICHDVVLNSYYHVVTPGSYYTLREAKARVCSHGYKKEKEMALIDVLDLVENHRSITKAAFQFERKERLDGKSRHLFFEALKELVHIGVNPVTIPENWNIDFVQNLLDAHINGPTPKSPIREQKKGLEIEQQDELVEEMQMQGILEDMKLNRA